MPARSNDCAPVDKLGLVQVMGFNYAYAGFDDVEAFVAAQHAGAEQQVRAFARFISRPALPEGAARMRRAQFAKAYNGPGYAENRYDEKMAAAYARYNPAPKAGRRKARVIEQPPAVEAAVPPPVDDSRCHRAANPSPRWKPRGGGIRDGATCAPIRSTCATGCTSPASHSRHATR
jgi:hypothetical protein